jgi:hypothetical protein
LALATSWRPAVGARWAASLESIMNTLRTELGGSSSGVAAPEVKAGHSSWRRDREAEVDHAAHKGQVA